MIADAIHRQHLHRSIFDQALTVSLSTASCNVLWILSPKLDLHREKNQQVPHMSFHGYVVLHVGQAASPSSYLEDLSTKLFLVRPFP